MLEVTDPPMSVIRTTGCCTGLKGTRDTGMTPVLSPGGTVPRFQSHEVDRPPGSSRLGSREAAGEHMALPGARTSDV